MTAHRTTVRITSVRPGWTQQAACQRTAVDMTLKANTAAARSVCAACTVRLPCLTEAMDLEAGDGPDRRRGVFGGLSSPERHQLHLARRDAAAARSAMHKHRSNFDGPWLSHALDEHRERLYNALGRWAALWPHDNARSETSGSVAA